MTDQYVDINGHEWTRQEMRDFASGARDEHTPANQPDNPYDRCAWCHYTSHPCDTYDLASIVLALLDEETP